MESIKIGIYEFSFSPRSFGGKRALIASVREDGFPFVLDRLVLDEHDQHLQAKIKQWLINQEAKDIDVIYFEKLIVQKHQFFLHLHLLKYPQIVWQLLLLYKH